MKLTKKQLADFRYDEWKSWVYDLKESHFFFLCPLHVIFLVREGLDVSSPTRSKHKCDYPGCLKKATLEFFPNLVTSLKESEKDCKNNRLYEMNAKGDLVKVKNYGKRTVQSRSQRKGSR